MFIRTHRIRDRTYTEALESYRDPATGKPKHRCLARWPADRTFAEYWAATMAAIRQQEAKGDADPRLLARLARLQDVRDMMPVRDADLHRALAVANAEQARIRLVTELLERGPTAMTAMALAEKARALARQNDPDTIRTGLTEIADALDAMAATSGR